jgi:RecB family exonuclease
MEQLQLDAMPRRLFVCTPSRLATYEDCPRRYRMTYLDRPAPPKGPPWAHISLGVSVHNALHLWWDEPLPRRTPEAAAHLVRRVWVEEGWRDADQSACARERSAAAVARYVARLDPADTPVGVERQVAARTTALALSGRIDRLDDRGGELVVVDYKTGRRPVTDDDARTSQALALYAVAAQSTFRRPCRQVELHHVPTATVAVAEHDDVSIGRHVRRAESVASDIVAATARLRAGQDRDEAFPTTPGRLCSWCDFRRHCPDGRAAAPALPSWAGVDDDARTPGPASAPGPTPHA